MSVPPGASYHTSNTYVKLKRRLLNLEAPVRIQFKDEWNQGNPLYDWYQRHGDHRITTMQLRKEKNAPFFHQYIVFELLDGHYFRIDRRQLPDETTPLDCIYQQGIEAYDTIEEVTSFEDASYSPSDCLAEIEFGEAIFLEFVLKILWAIHRHPSTRVYTLQRYNCYFVAQTILFLLVKSDIGFYSPERETSIHTLHDSHLSGLSYTTTDDSHQVSTLYPYPALYEINLSRPTIQVPMLSVNGPLLASVMTTLSQGLDRYDQRFRNICLMHWSSCSYCSGRGIPSQPPEIASGACSSIFSMVRITSRHSGLRTWDRLNDPDRIFNRFRSLLVNFWNNTVKNLCYVLAKKVMAKLPEACDKGKLDQAISEEVDAMLALDCTLETSWASCVHNALQKFAKDIDPLVRRALECLTWELGSEVTAEDIIHHRQMDNWVECVFKFVGSKYNQLEKELKTEITIRLNACLARRSIIHLGSDGSLIPSELSYFQDIKTEVSLTRRLLSNCRRRKPNAPEVDIVDITDLNDHLNALSMAHCIRVERYKLWLKCTREGVYADINRTREEIWRVVEGYSWVTANGLIRFEKVPSL